MPVVDRGYSAHEQSLIATGSPVSIAPDTVLLERLAADLAIQHLPQHLPCKGHMATEEATYITRPRRSLTTRLASREAIVP